jgi:hypothetical protein
MYLMNIKPTAPHLNAYIKTHKQDRPIRPVINNIPAPSYKTAKFLNKKLQQLVNLPNTYATKNSHEVALDLHNIRTNENHKLITLDIKDLYVNLPVQGIIQTTKFWLNRKGCDNTITRQTLHILEIILKQNYFQYNGQYYQPDKGIAMVSPISSTLAEIYLQYLEEISVKHWLENREIILYIRYVDDILILYDQTNTDKTTIYNTFNNTDKNLEFKITGEENNTISYLGLSINRNSNHIELGIYRKPTHMDIIIHRSSNHPHDQNLAAFEYYINRMVTLPITKQAAKQECEIIIAMAHNNGFPEQTVQKLGKKLRNKRDRSMGTQKSQQCKKR